MLLVVDESTDGRDVVELCMYNPLMECFREDVLGLLLNVNNMIICCLAYLYIRPFLLNVNDMVS